MLAVSFCFSVYLSATLTVINL